MRTNRHLITERHGVTQKQEARSKKLKIAEASCRDNNFITPGRCSYKIGGRCSYKNGWSPPVRAASSRDGNHIASGRCSYKIG